MKRRHKFEEEAEINITPMLDIVFIGLSREQSRALLKLAGHLSPRLCRP